MTLSKMLNLNAAIHFGLSAHQGLVSTPEYSATNCVVFFHLTYLQILISVL
jgi:hypothetical protein